MSMSMSISFDDDQLFNKMNDPNILWGDICDLMTTSDRGERGRMKRKEIQRQFPVLVHKDQNVYNIKWNRHKLSEWRKSNPDPKTWMDYESRTMFEMVNALRNTGWFVYAPLHPSFLCCISFEKQPMNTYVEYVKSRNCPVLLCLNDIKLFFPVIWHKVSNTSVYSIEMYYDRIRSTALRHGVNEDVLTYYFTQILTKTLSESPVFSVSQPCLNSEFCRLIIVN